MKKIIIVLSLTFLALALASSAQVSGLQSCANAGQEGDVHGIKCCSGLVSVPINVAPINGACLSEYPPYGTQFLCIKSGDGICGNGENKCNSPQDCPSAGKCAKCQDRCASADQPSVLDCQPTTESFECVYENGGCKKVFTSVRPTCGNGICETGENIRPLCPTSNCEGSNCPLCQMICEQDCNGQGVQVRTQLRVQQNNGAGLVAELSNGAKSEIKIMPETASQIAIERLGLKVCNETNNCAIQLKEVGQGNGASSVYEVQAEREYRILWIFKIRSIVSAEINAGSGDVASVKKPWWSFLAQ